MSTAADSLKPTILLVDDHPSLRLILSAGLKGRGFDVLTAATAEKALALCETFTGRIDLLFSDIGLAPPELWSDTAGREAVAHGVWLAEQVLQLRPGIKVALFTGHSDERLKRLGIVTRKFLIIRKPCDLPALVQTFHRLLTPADGRCED